MGSLVKRQWVKNGKIVMSRRFYIRYRDTTRRLRMEVAYTDRRASQALLAQRESEADRGFMGRKDPYVEHRRCPLSQHVADFVTHLAASGVGLDHRTNVRQHLERAFKAMGASHLQDVTTSKVERHLLALVQPRPSGKPGVPDRPGASHKTRNHIRNELSQFFAWAVGQKRWSENPVAPVKRLNAEAKPSRRRRAMTVEELQKLVEAAKARPLAACRAGSRASLSDEDQRGLELLGLQRSTLYLTAAMTGLRRNELKQLRWADLDLDAQTPTVTVRAETAKAKRTDVLPLAPNAAAVLKEWRTAWARANWRVPMQGSLVFSCVTRDCIDHFRADCNHAGLALDRVDGRLDFHSLRHTTATFLCSAGVPVRTAQELMRHRDPTTTMRVYAHVQGVERLEAVAKLANLATARPKEKAAANS